MVEWIDPSKASPGAYYKDIAQALVSKGYVRDLNIRGAPYDFRKGPSKTYHTELHNIFRVKYCFIYNFDLQQ